MPATSLSQLSLNEIIHICQEESVRAYHLERGGCLELFRRALDDKDETAWEAIERQYRALVCQWIYRVTVCMSLKIR